MTRTSSARPRGPKPTSSRTTVCKFWGGACALSGAGAGWALAQSPGSWVAGVAVLAAVVAAVFAVSCRGEHQPPRRRPPHVAKPAAREERGEQKPQPVSGSDITTAASPARPVTLEPDPGPMLGRHAGGPSTLVSATLREQVVGAVTRRPA